MKLSEMEGEGIEEGGTRRKNTVSLSFSTRKERASASVCVCALVCFKVRIII